MSSKVSFIIQFKNKFGKTADNLNRQFAKIERSAQKADSRMRKFEKRVESTRKLSGKLAKTGAVITAGLTAPIIFMSKKMVDAASDATETANKFNAVFDDVNVKANKVADNFSKSFGTAGSTARKLIGDTGDLLVGFGFSGDAALELSRKVNELAADLTSFQNVEGGVSSASAALTKALLGETESAKSLGIVIRQLDPVFKKQVKRLMRTQGLIQQQAKAIVILNQAQRQSKKAIGDVSRTWEDYASVVRRSEEQTKAMKESFGRLLIPAATVLMNKLTGVVKWLNNLSPAAKKTILVIAGIAAVVGPLILLTGGLAFALTSIVAAAPLVAAGVTAMAIAFGALSLPVLAVGAAIAAIGGILFIVWKNWRSIINNMINTINALLTPFNKLAGLFGFDGLQIKNILTAEQAESVAGGKTATPTAPVGGGSGTINGNILVSAEPGAQIKSTSMESSGSGMNLGMNMAAAGA